MSQHLFAYDIKKLGDRAKGMRLHATYKNFMLKNGTNSANNSIMSRNNNIMSSNMSIVIDTLTHWHTIPRSSSVLICMQDKMSEVGGGGRS